MNRWADVAGLLLIALLFNGCTFMGADMNMESVWTNRTKRILNVPGQAALQCVRRHGKIIPGGIAADDGTGIVSDWVTRRGQQQGLFWWRKMWVERRRFHLNIFAIADDSLTSVVIIEVEAQERPNANYEWQAVPDSRRAAAESEADSLLASIANWCDAR